MVTTAAAETTVPAKALDPKTVDFDVVLAQAKRPKPKPVSIFLRHDLYAEIEELDAEIDRLERRIKTLQAGDDDGVRAERSMGDGSPVVALERELDGLVERRNPLAEAFNASEITFEFRLVQRGDRIKAKAAMVADKHIPEDDEENEIFPCYMMAQTCTTVDWSGAKWLAFRDQIGEFPFLPLQVAVQDSGTAGIGMSGPFSQRPSPSRHNAT
jgi:hypothetical protein